MLIKLQAVLTGMNRKIQSHAVILVVTLYTVDSRAFYMAAALNSITWNSSLPGASLVEECSCRNALNCLVISVSTLDRSLTLLCILYCAFIVLPHTQGTLVQITQFYLQITPYLPFSPNRSPDGASRD